MGLTAAKIMLYATAIYIIDLMISSDNKKFTCYIWISVAISLFSLIPYSGWVFQMLVLFLWLKEVKQVIIFLAVAILIDMAFALALVPVFMELIG
jgi:hypothetical protein